MALLDLQGMKLPSDFGDGGGHSSYHCGGSGGGSGGSGGGHGSSLSLLICT